jgi:DNA-binding FrmR family transcriptional regulator
MLYTIGGYSMDRNTQKQEVLMRLRRIEGQVRGLQRMVEEGIACEQILTQVSAVSSAVKKAGLAMVQGYMDECLEKAGREKGLSQRDRLREFHKAISRYIDAA